MRKRRRARTNFKKEHLDKGRGDSRPGLVDKLEVADDGVGGESEVGRTVDLGAVGGGEVGVLVREEVADGVVDIFRAWCNACGFVDMRQGWRLCRGGHGGRGGGQALAGAVEGSAGVYNAVGLLLAGRTQECKAVAPACPDRIHLWARIPIRVMSIRALNWSKEVSKQCLHNNISMYAAFTCKICLKKILRRLSSYYWECSNQWQM